MHPYRNYVLDKLTQAVKDMKDLETTFPVGRYYEARERAVAFATILKGLE